MNLQSFENLEEYIINELLPLCTGKNTSIETTEKAKELLNSAKSEVLQLIGENKQYLYQLKSKQEEDQLADFQPGYSLNSRPQTQLSYYIKLLSSEHEQNDELSKRYASTLNENTKVNDMLQETATHLQSANAKLEECKLENVELKSENEQKKDQILLLQSQQENSKSLLSQKNAEVESLKSKINQLTNEKDQEHQQYLQLRQEFSSYKQQMSTKTFSEIMNMNEQLTEEKIRIQASYHEIQNLYDSVKFDYSLLQESYQQLKRNLDSAMKDNQYYKERLDNYRSTLGRVNYDQTLQQINTMLTEENTEYKKNVEQLEGIIADLRKQLYEMEMRVKETHYVNQRLSEPSSANPVQLPEPPTDHRLHYNTAPIESAAPSSGWTATAPASRTVNLPPSSYPPADRNPVTPLPQRSSGTTVTPGSPTNFLDAPFSAIKPTGTKGSTTRSTLFSPAMQQSSLSSNDIDSSATYLTEELEQLSQIRRRILDGFEQSGIVYH